MAKIEKVLMKTKFSTGAVRDQELLDKGYTSAGVVSSPRYGVVHVFVREKKRATKC